MAAPPATARTHEAGGDREHVGDDHVPQPQRVARGQREVAAADGGELEAHRERRARARRRASAAASASATPHRQRAGGDRAQVLARMAAVLLDVAHVVEQVGRAREHAEGDDGAPPTSARPAVRRARRPPRARRAAARSWTTAAGGTRAARRAGADARPSGRRGGSAWAASRREGLRSIELISVTLTCGRRGASWRSPQHALHINRASLRGIQADSQLEVTHAPEDLKAA